jgi:polyferredoxin
VLESNVQENIQAMLIALAAVCIGIVFSQLGSASPYISLVGTIFIMGAFIIGITAFLLFIRDLFFSSGGS